MFSVLFFNIKQRVWSVEVETVFYFLERILICNGFILNFPLSSWLNLKFPYKYKRIIPSYGMIEHVQNVITTHLPGGDSE